MIVLIKYVCFVMMADDCGEGKNAGTGDGAC